MDKKILKLDQDTALSIEPFEMRNLNPSKSETFETPTLTKSKMPKAAVSSKPERSDSRFRIDPVLKSLMSFDQDTENQIESRVREEVDRLKLDAEREGREQGYDVGYAQGLAEAKSSYELEAREKIERLVHLIDGFESVRSEIYQANERALVELLYRIAGSVLQRELLIDQEYVTRMVRSIVERVGVKEQLKIIAHSDQFENLYQIVPELEKKHARLKNVTIESSSELGKFDVVVETDWNRVDATIESQLKSLNEIVLAGLAEEQNSSSAPGNESESA